jgi:hypothetical protein
MTRFFCFLLLFASGAFAQTSSVPSTYQDIYTLLNTQISAFDSTIRAGWNGSSSGVVYAAQLETASAAQYTTLLGANYYTDVVLPELEELQALGVKGVDVHISFPILDPAFYSSNPSQYQQFVNFYQQLAKDVHSRGLKLIVENAVENQYPGANVGAFATYYQSLSWSEYMAGRAQNALNVATLIQPDYMSVIVEPDTEASYTGQTNAGTVAGSTQLLQTILTALQGSGVSIPIGAGAGTWIGSFTQFIQSFAASAVQYVDIHIYPVNNNYLTNAITAANMIHAAGKQAAISEAWDFKLNNDEVGVLSLLQTCARDPFSFWAPVDTAFLDALSDFANYEHLLFLSPFWSQYLHAYLDYNTYSTTSDSALAVDAETAATVAEQAGSFTATGLGWMNRILPARDTTPPTVPAAPTAPGIYPPAIMLNWTPSIDNVGVAGYNIYRNGQLITTTSLLSYFDQNLTPGAYYTYTLSAFDASGNKSAQSAPLKVETTDTTPPSVPTNVAVAGTTPTTVTLSWSPSTGIGGVAGYWVLSGKSATSVNYLAKVTSTSYTFPYGAPKTTYYFAIESINPLGIVSANSSTVSATTPALK